MTILAGFVYQDGVLICGDSRVENGFGKDAALKIFPIKGSWGEGLIGYSGTCDYAISAIQKLERSLSGCDPADIWEEFERALEAEYVRKVFAHPLGGLAGGPSYQFLVGLRPVGSSPELSVTYETTIHRVSGFSCIGVGADVANGLIKPIYLGNLEEEWMLTVAAYVLAKIKKMVSGCDDLSIFWALRKDGGPPFSFIGRALHRFVENLAQEFDRDVGQLLAAITCESDENFEWNVGAFSNKIKYFRAKWMEVKTKGIPTTIDELPRGI